MEHKAGLDPHKWRSRPFFSVLFACVPRASQRRESGCVDLFSYVRYPLHASFPVQWSLCLKRNNHSWAARLWQAAVYSAVTLGWRHITVPCFFHCTFRSLRSQAGGVEQAVLRWMSSLMGLYFIISQRRPKQRCWWVQASKSAGFWLENVRLTFTRTAGTTQRNPVQKQNKTKQKDCTV